MTEFDYATAATVSYVQDNEPVNDARKLTVRRVGPGGRNIPITRYLKRAEELGFVRYIPRVGWVANYQCPKSERPAAQRVQANMGEGFSVRRRGPNPEIG